MIPNPPRLAVTVGDVLQGLESMGRRDRPGGDDWGCGVCIFAARDKCKTAPD
jgi:hypothetical protein